MLQGLRCTTKQKNIVLGAAILISLALCVTAGFPELPSAKTGLGEDLTAEALRAFCAENVFAVSFFFFAAAIGAVTMGLGLALWGSGRENRDFVNACLDLGLFILLSGIWILTDSTFLSLFIRDWNAIGYFSFLSFMLMPLPVLRFFDYLIPGLRKIGAVDWLLSANLCCFLIITAVKADSWLMLLSLGIHHLLILYVIAVIGEAQSRQVGDHRNGLSAGLLAFLFLSLGALASFLLGRTDLYSVAYGIGLLSLIVTVFRKLVGRMLQLFRDHAELDRFREMAYTDALCRIGNRTAFQMGQQATAGAPRLCYVILDLNGLKQINDNLGHSVGDFLIHTAARLIEETFADSGKCYRIGGDEFAVICTELDEQGVQSVLNRLELAVNQRNRNQEIPLSLAWGYAMRKTPEDTVDVLFHRADEAMYACKQRQKKERT